MRNHIRTRGEDKDELLKILQNKPFLVDEKPLPVTWKRGQSATSEPVFNSPKPACLGSKRRASLKKIQTGQSELKDTNIVLNMDCRFNSNLFQIRAFFCSQHPCSRLRTWTVDSTQISFRSELFSVPNIHVLD